MTIYIDIDGYEWLPCHDGTYVAVDGDGYLGHTQLFDLHLWYGPLTEVVR